MEFCYNIALEALSCVQITLIFTFINLLDQEILGGGGQKSPAYLAVQWRETGTINSRGEKRDFFLMEFHCNTSLEALSCVQSSNICAQMQDSDMHLAITGIYK